MVVNPHEVADQIDRPEGSLHIGPSSIDLHIAGEKTELKEKEWLAEGTNAYAVRQARPGKIEIDDEETYPVERTSFGHDYIKVNPGEFCLARSQEELDLAYQIGAEVSGRSSVGRLGLFVENAGLVDRGFNGTITLELFNPTDRTIEIPVGSRVAQLVFFRQSGSKANAYDGKYNGQVEPTGSKLHQDEEL